MQLNLVNLLTAAPSVNLPSAAPADGVNFDDIFHQAQGLDLLDVAQVAAPDEAGLAPAPMLDGAMDEALLAQIREALLAMSNPQAANDRLMDGEPLPVALVHDQIVEASDLTVLPEAEFVEGIELNVDLDRLREFAQIPSNEQILKAVDEALAMNQLPPDLQRLAEQVRTALAPAVVAGPESRMDPIVREMPSIDTRVQPAAEAPVVTPEQLREIASAVASIELGVRAGPASAPTVTQSAENVSAPASLAGVPTQSPTEATSPATSSVATPATPSPIASLTMDGVSVESVRETSRSAEVRSVPNQPVQSEPLARPGPGAEAVVPQSARPVDVEIAAPAAAPDVGAVRSVRVDDLEPRARINPRERLGLDPSAPIREMAPSVRETAPMANAEQMVRGISGALEARPASVEPSAQTLFATARSESTSAAATTRPLMLSDDVAQLWIKNPDEVAERVMQQVGRLHANALRLQAGGAGDFVQRLTLNLFPAELGQVEVQLRTAEQMSVSFNAREAGTRDLLEAGVQRLRQMFEDQGLTLGDVDVGSQFAGEREAQEAETLAASVREGAVVESEEVVAPAQVSNPADGLHVIA